MRKQLLFILTIIISLNCYSQISFEKGYYIDNAGQKIDCFVRNIGMGNNPTEFEYKLLENSESKKETIKSVNEFGIYNGSKYIRKIVDIDRSSANNNNLSNNKKPIFKKEELFLKVLIEGKANLYEYVDGNLKRYFYKKESSNVEQLIFKTFNNTDSYIVENNRFRQQLWVDLKCENFTLSKIKTVDYNKHELVRFFTEYSECHNNSLVVFESKRKRDLFNLTIRPRLNNSSLTIKNSFLDANQTTDFGSRIGFGIGLEAEFILPFNKNEWSILIEPTYNRFKSEESRDLRFVVDGKLITVVDYSSIEVPIGIRRYFFLNKNLKIFTNLSLVFDFSSKSSVKLTRVDNPILNSVLEIDTAVNIAGGLGFKYDDTYSVEIRYQTNRDILQNIQDWSSKYKTLSIIFGYSLF